MKHNYLTLRLLIVATAGLLIVFALGLVPSAHGKPTDFPDPLEAEMMPAVAELPAPNKTRIYAHDAAFYSLTSGKVLVLDVGATSRNMLGLVPAAQFPSFQVSTKRSELYVAETFYSRGTRGDQTDVVTIYDEKTLHRKGEILLPENKRFQSVPQKASLSVSGNGKFLFVFNFTPASSVSVINLDSREVVNEIELSGCMLAYPYGSRNFMTQCGDGTIMGFVLSRDGKVTSSQTLSDVNDIDDDPFFMNSVKVDNETYFLSFNGNLSSIKTQARKLRLGKKRALLQSAEKLMPAAGQMRPSGWQVMSADRLGNIYVLMRENAVPGDHKYGGGYVWVVNARKGVVQSIIPLENEGFSIEVTSGRAPLLVVTRTDMSIDVYDLATQKRKRTISDFGPSMPISLHAR